MQVLVCSSWFYIRFSVHTYICMACIVCRKSKSGENPQAVVQSQEMMQVAQSEDENNVTRNLICEFQRIQQLESLLEEYQALNEHLTSEIDALGWSSGDSTSSLQTRTALLSELEALHREKVEVQDGSSVHLPLIRPSISLNQSTKPKPPPSPRSSP